MEHQEIRRKGCLGVFVRIALWGVALLFLAIALTPAVLKSFSIDLSRPQDINREVQLIEWSWFVAMGLLFALWLLFLGGSVASFLNVVAWRLPRGRSILGTSACPHCGKRLTFRENLPIIGWLKQEGISACCQQPIPFRYLGVELLLGSIFLIVGLLEIGFLAANIPKWYIQRPSGFFQLDGLHLCMVIRHWILISLLFAFCLFRWQGDRIPWSVFLVGLGAHALSLPLMANPSWLGAVFVSRQISLGLMGIQTVLAVVGAIGLGWALARLEARFIATGRSDSQRELVFALMLIGLLGEADLMFLTAASYAALTSLLVVLCRTGDGTRWLAPAHRAFIAFVVHLLVWRWVTLGDLAKRILLLWEG